MKKNIRPLHLFFSLISIFFNCNGSIQLGKRNNFNASTVHYGSDGYDSDRSVSSWLSTQSTKSDREFKLTIKKHVKSPDIELSPVHPRTLFTEFNQEVIKIKKRKHEENTLGLQSLPNNRPYWQVLIENKGENIKLEKYLRDIAKQDPTYILKNNLGQNPMHVAALTPGAHYSLGIVARVFPKFVYEIDNFGKLPEDYVCNQRLKVSLKKGYINSAKRISGILSNIPGLT